MKEDIYFFKEFFKRLGLAKTIIFILCFILAASFVSICLIYLFFLQVSTLKELVTFLASIAMSYIISNIKDIAKEWLELKNELNKKFQAEEKSKRKKLKKGK